MNRLIIIGNGFDLAHGLKTSYADFLLWYLKKSMRNRHNLKSGLIEIEFGSSLVYDKHETVNDLLSTAKVNCNTVKGVGFFIESILKDVSTKNWVDIERAYYKQLHKEYDSYKNEKHDSNKNQILARLQAINNQLEELKNELIEYLKDVDENFDITSVDYEKICKILKVKINVDLDSISREVEHCKILNFNYTSTVSKYLDFINSDKISELKIHGNLEDINSVIFGFGDEMDINYSGIEELNENVFFQHIKSFKYLNNSLYKQLISFIGGEEKFEVYVIGHSLGLSDRTMLSEIFNSKNLENVKIFYYDQGKGKNDYTEKTFEISRHFKDNANMRVKIVSKDESVPMPKLF